MFFRIPVLLVLLLGAFEARAVTWRPPPQPTGPDVPKRYALDATLSTLTIAGVSFAGGARARVRDDPFEFELSYERDLTEGAQRDLRWVVLGGGGLARALNARWDLFGSFLLGAYGVEILADPALGRQPKLSPATGLRIGLSRRFPALGTRFVEPTVGVSTTLLLAARRHDSSSGISWGGPSAMVSLSMGAQTVAASGDRG